MSSGQMSELLGQSETVPHMLRRHKVLCHLDTAVQVVHLSAKEQSRNKKNKRKKMVLNVIEMKG